ncbi:phytanoyl-CoA dioxygenase family protein [Sphingomonas sp. 37zxx]|uniref:phytanoyl-CoA dioxygenase family protein n=1 Tax=Sphingomonas sp. 37zxx TaxID=1550073 RepID=UPI00053BFC5C|nr:phytanoyl-CoA dioxygenase family protein [Sphingomonas sp. 37zxx]
MTINMEHAVELSAAAIMPAKILRDSSDAMDDHAELNRRYEEEGYLYFRGLIHDEVLRRARARMIAALEREGLAIADGDQAVWTGGDRPTLPEVSPAYAGIVDELVTDPRVLPLLEKILGEPATTVPMVQYRAYKPNNKLGGVHQDGFHSPGIHGYRPLWIALVDMEPAMGGLVLAPNHTREGFFHNIGQPPRFPVPQGVIPEEDWARAEYRAGDVVVLHPYTPHVGLPNTSGHLRLSIDTRVQSAAHPATIVGTLRALSAESIALELADGTLRPFGISEATFIRTGENRGRRMSRAELLEQSPLGLKLLAALDGDQVTMLRQADFG